MSLQMTLFERGHYRDMRGTASMLTHPHSGARSDGKVAVEGGRLVFTLLSGAVAPPTRNKNKSLTKHSKGFLFFGFMKSDERLPTKVG